MMMFLSWEWFLCQLTQCLVILHPFTLMTVVFTLFSIPVLCAICLGSVAIWFQKHQSTFQISTQILFSRTYRSLVLHLLQNVADRYQIFLWMWTLLNLFTFDYDMYPRFWMCYFIIAFFFAIGKAYSAKFNATIFGLVIVCFMVPYSVWMPKYKVFISLVYIVVCAHASILCLQIRTKKHSLLSSLLICVLWSFQHSLPTQTTNPFRHLIVCLYFPFWTIAHGLVF